MTDKYVIFDFYWKILPYIKSDIAIYFSCKAIYSLGDEDINVWHIYNPHSK